jgi:hypothetical protein
MPNTTEINQDLLSPYDLTSLAVEDCITQHANIFEIFWDLMILRFNTHNDKSVFYIIYLVYQYKTLINTSGYEESRAHRYLPEFNPIDDHQELSEYLITLIDRSLTSNPDINSNIRECENIMRAFFNQNCEYINNNYIFRGMIKEYNNINSFDELLEIINSHPNELWDPDY